MPGAITLASDLDIAMFCGAELQASQSDAQEVPVGQNTVARAHMAMSATRRQFSWR